MLPYFSAMLPDSDWIAQAHHLARWLKIRGIFVAGHNLLKYETLAPLFSQLPQGSFKPFVWKRFD